MVRWVGLVGGEVEEGWGTRIHGCVCSASSVATGCNLKFWVPQRFLENLPSPQRDTRFCFGPARAPPRHAPSAQHTTRRRECLAQSGPWRGGSVSLSLFRVVQCMSQNLPAGPFPFVPSPHTRTPKRTAHVESFFSFLFFCLCCLLSFLVWSVVSLVCLPSSSFFALPPLLFSPSLQ